MRVLIIEDERIAAQTLHRLIYDYDSEIEVVDVLQTIEDSVEWFQTHSMPDLVFMDIHLSDGSSFSIFDHVDVKCPIIFTTAYDEYAIKAFEVNSIGYLLKPIDKDDFAKALNKFKTMSLASDKDLLHAMLKQLKGESCHYKSNFIIQERDRFIPLPTHTIACVYIDSKMVYAVTLAGKSFPLNQPLDELMDVLDPYVFFRANRQYIISRNAIRDFNIWFGNKLLVNIIVPTPEKIVVSKARVTEFKNWFSS